jgi:hypothetical protein
LSYPTKRSRADALTVAVGDKVSSTCDGAVDAQVGRVRVCEPWDALALGVDDYCIGPTSDVADVIDHDVVRIANTSVSIEIHVLTTGSGGDAFSVGKDLVSTT